MGKQGFSYTLLCIGLCLGLSIIEIFVFKPLIEFVGEDIWKLMIVYNVLFIVVNPIIVKIIIDKFFHYKADTQM